MALQFAARQEEELWDVDAGNNFQYSHVDDHQPNESRSNYRKGRSSQPHYSTTTESNRRRTRSADARPQYASITQNSLQHPEREAFDPFADVWSPDDYKRRLNMPYDPSSTFPAGSISTNRRQMKASNCFPASDAAESNELKESGDWRSNMINSAMVLKPKDVKDSAETIASGHSSTILRSRSQSPASRRQSGTFRSQDIARQARGNNTTPHEGVSLQSKSAEDYGSFEVDYDFYGDGFAQSRTFSHDGSQSDHFQVIRPDGRPNAPSQYSNRRVESKQLPSKFTSNRPAPLSYAEFLANSNVPGSHRVLSKKVSPTSVTDDINNDFNVRWSQDLAQEPSRTRDASVDDHPKSILRKRYSTSDDYRVRNSDVASTRLHFADGSRMPLAPIERSASPIKSGFDDPIPFEAFQQEPDAKSVFLRNIPQEYQQAFRGKNVPNHATMDESDLISDAYNDFIESVASVVVQTAARRFLAKLRVERIRAETAAARKYRYNRRRIGGKGRATSVVNRAKSRRKLQTESVPNLRLENQLFDIAATMIQALWRGWFVRDLLKIEDYCAAVIQKNFRTFQYQNQYQYDLFRIVIAQSVVRRYLVCRNMVVSPNPGVQKILNFAVTMIQARWRGFKARKLEKRSTESKPTSRFGDYGSRRGFSSESKPTNRFSKYGARRGFANSQQNVGAKQASRWSNLGDVAQPTSSKPASPIALIDEEAARVGTSHRPHQRVHRKSTGMNELAKRRATLKSNRLTVIEQERDRQEKEANEKSELKAMQRRIGLKTSPSPPGAAPQRAKSFSGRIQSQSDHRVLGARIQRRGRAPPLDATELAGSVVPSDFETERRNNRSNTSRVLEGWRNRERSNSFDQKYSINRTDERIKEIEDQGTSQMPFIGLPKCDGGKATAEVETKERETSVSLSYSGTRVIQSQNSRQNASSNVSIQEERSEKEAIRIQKIEDVFMKVGLMRPTNNPRRVNSQQPSAAEKKPAIPLRNTNHEEPIVDKNQVPQWTHSNQRFGVPSPKTERKLFHEEPTSKNKPTQVSWKNARQSSGSSNQEPRPPRQKPSGAQSRIDIAGRIASSGNERSKNLMNSLGMNTSFISEGSTDVEDEGSSPSPAFMRRFRKAPPSPLQKAVPSGAPEAQMTIPPPTQRPLSSQYQIQKRGERSKEEQFKIDGMHAVFARVGLMSRDERK